MAESDKSLRTFLALPLTGFFSAPVKNFLDQHARTFKSVKWVRPDQIHVTFHFFGTTTEEEIPVICEIVSQEVLSQEPFQIGLEDFATFPALDSRFDPNLPKGFQPRVLWTGT